MSGERAGRSLANLGRALDRLEEAVAEPEGANRLVIDGTIQRFEFALELFWKTLRRVLEEEGVATATPREAIGAGYAAGWLSDEALWLAMLRDRNRTSHIYSEAMAREIWTRIRDYAPVMRAAYGLLGARAG
jgi:nucleotidyltransferase substrate binding protein (TIGR01987 family)